MQANGTPVVLDLERPVSRRVDQRARQALKAGAVRLTAVNGLDPQRRAVLLAIGVHLPATVRQVKGRVNAYTVEVDQREDLLTAYCTCLGNQNGRLCYHAVSLYRAAAAGAETVKGGCSA